METSTREQNAPIPGISYSKYLASTNRKNLSDEELVRLFAEEHNEGAISEVINRYSDKIYRLGLRITRNPNDAEEVLQEVFLTLLKNIDKFRGESKFGTWLYRVALNASYMQIRSKKRKYENELSLENYASYDEDGALKEVEIADWSDMPDEALSSSETMQIIEKAINELPEAYKVVFQMRDIEGLSNEKVAEILGLTIPNVKSRIHRARLFLRDKLSGYFYP